jgi:hypothetical protein
MKKALSLLPVLGLLIACAEQVVPVSPSVVQELPTPAAQGSGEPFLSTGKDGVFMTWIERSGDGVNALKLAHLVHDGWSEPTVIAESDAFFVNWADFPSVTQGQDGTLWAHWLQRGGTSTYDYGIRVVRSHDLGASWSEPWTLHGDGTPTEHGFVSTVSLADGVGFTWLDGRETPATREMTVRYRSVNSDGTPGPETLLDARVCDCCQTGMTLTPAGPVAIYRNRSTEEIRDIYITRQVDGVWTEGQPVHNDGWHIEGCPVNGPSVEMAGDRLAVAWFTGADDEGRVKLAFSDDLGASFGDPIVIDDGNPAGRVDLVGMADGSVLVTWMERTGGEDAEVRVRRVGAAGAAAESTTLSSLTDSSRGARATGFPRIVPSADGSFIVAWTDASQDPSQVRVSRLILGS